MAWWKEGMEAFLQSPASPAAQDAAWVEMIKPVIENALTHGWTDERRIAIALGIANSVGAAGFASLAGKQAWKAEATLIAYAASRWVPCLGDGWPEWMREWRSGRHRGAFEAGFRDPAPGIAPPRKP